MPFLAVERVLGKALEEHLRDELLRLHIELELDVVREELETSSGLPKWVRRSSPADRAAATATSR
jgi:hypothetical protein